MIKIMKIFYVLFICAFNRVRSHSWLACTDYMVKNGRNWNSNKCRGFPRDAYKFAPKHRFGYDTMYNHEPSQTGTTCKTQYRRSSYNKQYPKAVYYPGQQVVIVHPMKTHGSDYCTNKYIPDHGSMIYRGRKNTDLDRKLNFYKKFEVANLGISPYGPTAGRLFRKYPKPGYQNAPNFCKNKDKAMGTYSFNVPKNMVPGKYTFVWVWSFSRIDHTYTTCFDVIVARHKKARDAILKRRGFKLKVICGGKTSDLSLGSTVGCNDGATKNTSNHPSTYTTATTPHVIPLQTTPNPTTTSTSTTARTTSAITRVATTKASKPSNLVRVYEIRGETDLPNPRRGITRRTIQIKFGCPSRAYIWNAQLKRKQSDRVYIVTQRIYRGRNKKAFLRATFSKSCPIETRNFHAFLMRER